MDSRTEVRDFLRTRRAKVTPEQAGIVGGSRRRVPGLRREEVALLANVSVDYYARLERGDLSGASDEILDSIARALQLDEAEATHLFDLARAAQRQPATRRRPSSKPQVRASLQRLLDAVTDAPVWVRNERMDFVAMNALGRALYAPVLEGGGTPPNNARFLFLDPAAQEFYPDWKKNMDEVVATLRGYAGRNPHNKGLTDLIGELAAGSKDFSTRWAAHDVRFHRTGIKRIHHPVVGDLELDYEAMELPANPGWTMFAYTALPGSPSDERLRLLASWAATNVQAETRTPEELPTDSRGEA
ncbi:transcriptional regulator with XRE-family HTH domain [Sinomonas atrocyanea]|uniref:helix-turn-helix domain-containing protein n=1 Tax=Sinomonas atrocyanea TaxID=37927 RepID=UPI002781E5C8|nr:helix-turn-helix transcriptional regulator [Sinomonas atrocyanea]MDP9886103.1 transcriptional regulator with XRE-family HTH domain [Sinomonas atrocyanea]